MLRAIFIQAIFAFITLSSPANAIQFAGSWANVAEDNAGLTRIEVYQSDNAWMIRCWAPKGDQETDLGKTTLTVLGDATTCPNCTKEPEPPVDSKLRTSLGSSNMNYGFARWDYGFKETYLTLRLQDEHLIVEDYNTFKDDSGRTNYRIRYVLEKSKKTDTTAPQ